MGYQEFENAGIILVQGHRLTQGDAIGRAQKFLRTKHWSAGFAPADVAKHDKTSAGTAILWRPWLQIKEVGTLIKTSRALSMVWTTKQLGDLLVVCIYGFSGEKKRPCSGYMIY